MRAGGLALKGPGGAPDQCIPVEDEETDENRPAPERCHRSKSKQGHATGMQGVGEGLRVEYAIQCLSGSWHGIGGRVWYTMQGGAR